MILRFLRDQYDNLDYKFYNFSLYCLEIFEIIYILVMYNLFDSDYNYDIILSMNKTIERETGNVYTIPIKSNRNKQTIS